MIVALFVLASWPASALDDSGIRRMVSAAYVLDGCKDKEKPTSQGRCLGQIEIILFLGFADSLAPKAKFCPPDGATVAQTQKVILKYIEDRPQRLHEPFMFLALEAVRAAWPCSN
jgi:hypothetical protein